MNTVPLSALCLVTVGPMVELELDSSTPVDELDGRAPFYK